MKEWIKLAHGRIPCGNRVYILIKFPTPETLRISWTVYKPLKLEFCAQKIVVCYKTDYVQKLRIFNSFIVSVRIATDLSVLQKLILIFPRWRIKNQLDVTWYTNYKTNYLHKCIVLKSFTLLKLSTYIKINFKNYSNMFRSHWTIIREHVIPIPKLPLITY